MRKYFQITSVLGIFGLLVLFRQYNGEVMPAIGKNQTVNNPTQAATATPTPSQAQQQINNQNSVQSASSPTPTPSGIYKNGTYTGSVADAFYGNIQVQVVISDGKISNINFLQYPNDNHTSQYVNSLADPMLAQEAIAAQSANVDIISGASASSQAFQQSLADALSQAK